jgi:biopolymer transport protein ExbD
VLIYLLLNISLGMTRVLSYRFPKGLMTHLLIPEAQAQSSPGIQPVYVRLESGGINARPSLYVDSQPVPWENFETVLRKELRLRHPDWPVYLEADPDMEWKWPVMAIDKIRGLQAQVILLTRQAASSLKPSGSTTRPNSADALHPRRR